MKFTFIAVLLFPLLCFANPINVTATGKTYEEARHNAFREAIEYKVGTIVLSEREQHNLKLVRNNVLSYSAGYVDSFTVLSTEHRRGYVVINVDVVVNESKLYNMILSQPKEIKNFDSARHSVQYQTYIDQRNASDGFVFSVMRHYPQRAFNLKQLPYAVKVDKDKNFIISVPYELEWNQNFVHSFEEMLSNIEDGRRGAFAPSIGNVVVVGKTNINFVAGNRTQYRFNDRNRIADIRNFMLGDNEARIRVLLLDRNGSAVIDRCYYPEFMTGRRHSFYALGDPSKISVFANQIEKHYIDLVFPYNKKNVEELDRISSIELSIVSHKTCSFKM